MKVKIDKSWAKLLKQEFEKDYFRYLTSFVRSEYNNHTVYPPGSRIFSAFDYCPLDELRVVILGQDPYHGAGQANGLCFSVNPGTILPPSLRNIFKEVVSDLNCPFPKDGNLERWANQGVLLLNATLTVRAGSAGSHQGKGWEQFTDHVISKISLVKEHLVFLLWGAFAQKKALIIDQSKHLILKSPHPSPFSADRGFFGNRHFSQCNDYLKANGVPEIKW